jgi:hypothetical protein
VPVTVLVAVLITLTLPWSMVTHAEVPSGLTVIPTGRAAPTGWWWLRRLANRLVGILDGCLKTRTLYNEGTPGSHRQQQAA